MNNEKGIDNLKVQLREVLGVRHLECTNLCKKYNELLEYILYIRRSDLIDPESRDQLLKVETDLLKKRAVYRGKIEEIEYIQKQIVHIEYERKKAHSKNLEQGKEN